MQICVIKISLSFIILNKWLKTEKKIYYLFHIQTTFFWIPRNGHFFVCFLTKYFCFFIYKVAFLGSWTPYAFLALYVVITKNNQIHPLLATFPLVLAKCAPIWNPYIYFMRDTKFNHECRKMLPILSRLGLWRVNPGSQDDHVMNLNDTISRKTSTYV